MQFTMGKVARADPGKVIFAISANSDLSQPGESNRGADLMALGLRFTGEEFYPQMLADIRI